MAFYILKLCLDKEAKRREKGRRVYIDLGKLYNRQAIAVDVGIKLANSLYLQAGWDWSTLLTLTKI